MTLETPTAAALELDRSEGPIEAAAGYDVEAVRSDFAILGRKVHGRPGKPGRDLVYLDSAASAQKPRPVVETLRRVYDHEYSNVHRGLHFLSNLATDRYEAARETMRGFLNAASKREIIFTKSATEGFNLIASSFGSFLQEGDEIVLSQMEHHANIVPWQLLRSARGVVIKVAPVTDRGELDMEAFEALLGPRTKLVAMTHCSNVLGTITPAREIIRLAHAHGAAVVLDGSQGAVHLPSVDVQDLDVDFYVFTGHKLYGPTGIGVVYGKREHLERMPPYQGGGEMIHTVTFEETTFAEVPARFEAGTPPIAQAIGLAAAIDYTMALGRDAIFAHERALLDYATARLSDIPGLHIYGQAPEKASIISFTMDCAHPHDIGTVIDTAGVAVRAGHHCAQPLMARFGLAATARASFGLYNTTEEVDILADALTGVREIFG
jgi:cysteine desulfurase/selenocysteine lyase